MVENELLIGPGTLARAVALGVISADQAQRLKALAREAHGAGPPSEPQDDEKLRLVSGFGDIFITIGMALFLGAAAYFAYRTASLLGAGLTVAVLAWGLAEYFTRLRRTALPSIVLVAVFALSSFVALGTAIAVATGHGRALGPDAADPFNIASSGTLDIMLAGLGAAALVALHYWRFRVPITVAAFAAAILTAVTGLLGSTAPGLVENHFSIIALLFGVVIFIWAMRFDLSDPDRLTRRSDIAFWLHLLAAPLIVHSLIGGMIVLKGETDTGTAATVLAVFLGLAVVAVLVDRRAILVSGLTYAGLAFGTILRQTVWANQSIPAALLVLGAFILLLSAGWRPIRAILLRLLPDELARRLPHMTVSP